MPADNVALHADLEDTEDTLSFCDLPLHNNDDELNWKDSSTDDSHTSLTDQNEFFEFSSDPSAKTCPSENIIFCGKLTSYKQPLSDHTHNPKSFEFHRQRRFDPLNMPRSSPWGSDRGRVMSGNCSLGRDIFQRASRSRTSRTPSSSYRAPAKSIWYSLTIGLTKFSPEMELKDIRSRQNRLNQSSMGPAFKGGETASVKSGGKGSWGLLRAFGWKVARAYK